MKYLRKSSGSAITETGPALFILLIFTFFPMLDILQLGAAYAISNTYHQYISREVAFRRPEQSALAIAKVNTEIANNPVFQFVGIKVPSGVSVDPPVFVTTNGTPVAPPQNPNDVSDPTNNVRRSIAKVRIRTTVTCIPYFTVPFFNNIPGLGAPVPFVSSSERPQDEKGLN